MDNITHTLVGAALAEAGLKRRTALGAATLMIGANFPDVDVLAVPLGRGLEWRRGVTHGVLALVVLPFVLAWLMLQWDKHVRRRREPTAAPAQFRELTILAAIAIATHPTLDFMNTYGMRWLMPFVDRWYYADGLFIVDFWILVTLAVAVWWSVRGKNTTPARVGLATVAAYTTLMLVITGLGQMRVQTDYPGRRIMVGPNAVIPWRRDVLIDEPTAYRVGTYSLFGGIGMAPYGLPKGDVDPAVAEVRKRREAQRFLRWARFPMFSISRDNGRTVVTISDARYDSADWASVTVTLP